MVVSEIISYIFSNPSILIALFLLYCFVYGLSILFSGPKPGRNPFAARYVRPPPPLVTEHSERYKVLKYRFKQNRIPDDIDTIIVGSGIGGLTTAVLLGRAGHKVLVLEQHDQAGGCCHTFVEKGYEFDTGIHYVGKMMDGDQTRVFTDQVTEGQVVWTPMDNVFDTVTLGPSEKAKFYPLKCGSKEEFARNAEELFPKEKKAIAEFMKLLDDCRGTFLGVMVPKFLPRWLAMLSIKTGIYQLVMRKFMRLTKLTVKQALDDLSDDQEFKACMSYIFGDMGVVPSKLSMMGFATVLNHYIPGSFYPLGGTSEIAFQIVQVIEKYGGRVMVDAPVSQILVNEKGRVHGVRVKKSSGEIDIFAKRVISDAGIINTLKHLLPKEVAEKSPIYPMLGQQLKPSVSYLTAFIGLEGSQEELQLPKGNFWSFCNANFEDDLEAYVKMSVEEAADGEVPLMFTSFPSAKDAAWEEKNPGKSVALVITLLPWEWFSRWETEKIKHRGDDYNGLKMRIGQQMWRQLENMFPKLQGKMTYLDVGTPLSNKYYLGQSEGEMYGLDHNIDRFLPEVSMELRPESGIKGLYFTGQDILTCGFSGAMHAGLLTASKVLHRNLLNDLTAVTKEVRASNKKVKTE
ncbi:all-trans-retinol 13,14-reductase-like [Mya arenaria]|uniref:all-trans-retinol 13,14-reductase-like n=1 Tax=Mya arenaria TaxID=6604 RepID=UPI0022E147A3|nr:all-trans-retinol 13,14-reductase-like [Mya arenaria]